MDSPYRLTKDRYRPFIQPSDYQNIDSMKRYNPHSLLKDSKFKFTPSTHYLNPDKAAPQYHPQTTLSSVNEFDRLSAIKDNYKFRHSQP